MTAGGKAVAAVCYAEDGDAIVKVAVEKFGTVHILVANAGITYVKSLLESMLSIRVRIGNSIDVTHCSDGRGLRPCYAYQCPECVPVLQAWCKAKLC